MNDVRAAILSIVLIMIATTVHRIMKVLRIIWMHDDEGPDDCHDNEMDAD